MANAAAVKAANVNKGAQPMLQLYFKRAKIFLDGDGTEERRFVAPVSTDGPIPAPAWIASTLTYQYGVKDKSILDLTPPTRRAAAVKAAEVANIQALEIENTASRVPAAPAPAAEQPQIEQGQSIAEALAGQKQAPLPQQAKVPTGFQNQGNKRR